MGDAVFKLRILAILLMVAVTATAVLNTCASDRLERQFIDMRAKVKAVVLDKEVTVDLGPVLEEVAGLRAEVETLRADIATRTIAAGSGNGGTTGTTPAAAADRAGQESPVTAVGWGGRRARVTYVTGATPEGVLRIKDKPKPQNDFYVNRRNSGPSSCNYYVTSEGETAQVTKYILAKMLEMNADRPEEVYGGLAHKWETSEDKLTYTFHLRKGVQFADGRPFSSKDVQFSWDVMQDPTVKADHLRGAFDRVETLTTPDDYTVVVKYKLKHWKGVYAVGTTLRTLNKAWYEDQVPVWAEKLGISKYSVEPGKPGFGEVFNKIRIPCPGAGPYYMRSEEDFNQDRTIQVQNPFFYGMQIWPERYNFLEYHRIYIGDDVTAEEAFRKQEFDMDVVDHDAWEDDLSKDPTILKVANHYVYDHVALDCSYIAWNCRIPPFDDPKVRLAMTHLMNRKWIVDEIERGNATVADCKSKRIYKTYSNDLVSHPFDIEKAKALLTEAGWTDTDGDGVLDKDGKRFEFEFKVPNVRTFFRRVGGALEDACKKAGIRMTLQPIEWSTFIEDLNNRRFDAICLYNAWSDPWIDLYEEGFHSSQDVPYGNNIPGWRNPRIDELTSKMQEEFDEEKRTAMFHEFNRIFHEEQPYTLLVHGKVGVLANKRLQNVRVRKAGLTPIDYWVEPEDVLHK